MATINATVYDTVAAAEAALDALDSSIVAEVEAFEDRGVTKWMVVVHPPMQHISKLGYNPDVDAAKEDLWSVGGLYVWPTAEMGMEIVSSSADDAAEGTGARTVKIWYLDDAFVEKTETITLTGVTPVATVATDIYRINRFKVMTVGSGGVAAGDIDIRNIGDTPIYSRVVAGETESRDIPYTVPAGKLLNISQVTYSVGGAKTGVFGKYTLKSTYDQISGAVGTIFYPISEIGVQDGAFTITYVTPIQIPAGADLIVSIQSGATNADAVCTIQYRGWLE